MEKQVDIFVYEPLTGAYFRIPVVPETFEYTDGEALTDTVQIAGLGNVDFFTGVDLDSLTWSSFFPARYDPSYCSHPKIHDPLTYRNQFSTWKDANTTLQIICPAYGLNKAMFIKSFTWTASGAEGDIEYTLTFRQFVTLMPRQVTPGGEVVDASVKTAEQRAAASSEEKPPTYEVKGGDTLFHIAKRYNIADWRTIYEKNKSVIGANPNLIKPGQVLTL